MEGVVNSLQQICQQIMPYATILSIVSFVVIGVMLIVPSDEAHQKAKKAVPWVVIGAIVLMGAVSIGTWLTDQITF